MIILNRILITCFVCICILLPAGHASAHNVRIFAWIEGNIISGETSFSGGRKPHNAAITVFNKKTHTVLTTTTTDAQGTFHVPLPPEVINKQVDLVLVVNSGEGHRGEWILPAQEFVPVTMSIQQDVKETIPVHSNRPQGSNTSGCLNKQEFRTLVETVVEQRLAPLKQMIARNSNQRPGLRDILGGVGYIIGLAGIIAWMKSKKISSKESK